MNTKADAKAPATMTAIINQLDNEQLRAENDRLRKALEHCLDVMKDPWKHGDGCISRAIYMADAALAASTEQEE